MDQAASRENLVISRLIYNLFIIAFIMVFSVAIDVFEYHYKQCFRSLCVKGIFKILTKNRAYDMLFN